MTHYSLDFSNLAEFDALAQSIAARLGCQISLISVMRGDVVFAMGHSGRGDAVTERSMPARDTICARTVQAGVPLRVANVRSDADLRTLPAVQALGIGAYLGVPLTMDNGATVGAICALSTSARIWQDSELDYLHAVADLAESKLERHLLRYERQALSAALAENDAILSTLSQMRGRAMTVHNAEGELVFANSAMHTDLALSDADLLALPCITRQLRRRAPQAGPVQVVLPAPTCTELSVLLSTAENGLVLAEWSRGQDG